MDWQLQDAKNRFSEVVSKARREGPQTVTLRGDRAAIVLSAEDYDRLTQSRPTLADHLLSGPIWDDSFAGDVTARNASRPRDIDFSATMYLLDTNIVSEARRGSAEASAWIRSVKGRSLHLSVITLGEIMRGIELKQRKDAKAAAALAEWLIALRELHRDTILPISDAVALEWARLSAGQTRNTADGLIAATARVHDLILVTRNVADFEGVGVSVVNPWDL